MKILVRMRNELARILRSDPVKYCELYRDSGCSHVDGFLCHLETCEERLEYVELLKKKILKPQIVKKRKISEEPLEKILEMKNR
jgi:hypothetical protein